VATFIGRL